MGLGHQAGHQAQDEYNANALTTGAHAAPSKVLQHGCLLFFFKGGAPAVSAGGNAAIRV
jgi:hypothetical protein